MNIDNLVHAQHKKTHRTCVLRMNVKFKRRAILEINRTKANKFDPARIGENPNINITIDEKF